MWYRLAACTLCHAVCASCGWRNRWTPWLSAKGTTHWNNSETEIPWGPMSGISTSGRFYMNLHTWTAIRPFGCSHDKCHANTENKQLSLQTYIATCWCVMVNRITNEDPVTSWWQWYICNAWMFVDGRGSNSEGTNLYVCTSAYIIVGGDVLIQIMLWGWRPGSCVILGVICQFIHIIVGGDVLVEMLMWGWCTSWDVNVGVMY